MRGRGPSLGVLTVAVCLGVLLLALSLPVRDPSDSSGLQPAHEALAVSIAGSASSPSTSGGGPSGTTPSGAPIVVSLSVNSASVAVGAEVTFLLTISLAVCTTFPLSSLGELTISYGDGTSYQESGNNGGPGAGLRCLPPPSPNDTSTTDGFQYAYPNTGSYSVSAQVNWSSGPPLHTNGLTVVVSESSIAFAADGWFYGVVGTGGGALVLVFVFRRKLPEPPSLPPGGA